MVNQKNIDRAMISDLENNSDILGMYSFYDTKADRYDTPFFCQNDMFANRHYRMISDKKETMINKFKREFNLVRLGYYHMEAGEFIEFPETLIEGKHLPKEEK